jgi:predicted RNase H-like nuclease (RuvC/YqgF family)
MADMQELLESQVVQEEPPQGGDAPADAQVAEAPKRPRVKRSSVKAVENRAAELEQRIEALAEQVAQFSRRVVALEESRHQSQTHGGASHNGGDLAEHVRQLDERVQKLANYLTQQNWGVNRV